MRTRKFLFWGLSLLISSACNTFYSATDAPTEVSFLPGECLSSDNLKFRFDINDNYAPLSFVFAFWLDIDKTTNLDELPDMDYRYIPSESVFDMYGENAEIVRKRYEDVYKTIRYGHGNLRITSIFYDGGITLTADKDFAGHSVGQNLIPYCYLSDVCYPKEDYPIPVDEGFSYSNTLRRSFAICFPIDGRNIIDEKVTFTLNVPVKVGLYLTWLNDKVEDSEAIMSCNDEILHCTFTINKKL